LKILALDIETMFITAGAWGLFDQNISIGQVLDPGGMICWSAKYVGEKATYFRKKGDKLFLKELHQLLSECNAVLSYNGDRFDLKKINTAFLKAGLTQPPPIKSIDLLKTFKKKFSFISNKLQYVCTELEVGSKVDHEGFPLWIKCAQGDQKAWKKMETYNRGDVLLLEKLYRRVEGWVSNGPSHSLMSEARVCPECGSKHLQERGYRYTKTGKYKRLQCIPLGHWSSERISTVDKDKRQNILVSL